jgi:hypothetical protein
MNNTDVYGNNGIWGGGIHLVFNNVQLSVSNCIFHLNAASYGGALYIGEGHYDVTLYNSQFVSNVALVSGGAVSASVSVALDISDCIMSSNVASAMGGAVYYKWSDLTIRSTLISHSYASTGGGIYLTDGSNIVMEDVMLDSNYASLFGGGLFITSSEDVILHRMSLFSNAAFHESGGGINIHDSSNVLLNSSYLVDNIALNNGGAISVASANNISITNNFALTNYALNGSGSVMWIDDSDMSVVGNVMINNSAMSGGGTVFWVYSLTMKEEPLGLSNSNTMIDNIAKFGNDFATTGVSLQPVNASGSDSNEHPGYRQFTYNTDVNVITEVRLTSYVNPIMPIEVRVADYYSQTDLLENSLSVKVIPISTNGCNGRTELVIGKVVEVAKEGKLLFNDLSPVCYPGGNMSMEFTTTLHSESVASSVQVKFRQCGVGEYYGDGGCHRCPVGTFSLVDNWNNEVTACRRCPAAASNCEGNIINVTQGYWRMNENTYLLQECPFGNAACAGGEEPGDGSCHPGYEGPLCSVCSDGYYFQGSLQQCTVCENGGLNAFIYALVGLFSVTVFIAIAKKVFSNLETADTDDLVADFSVTLVLLTILIKLRSYLIAKNKKAANMTEQEKLEFEDEKLDSEEELHDMFNRMQPKMKIYISLLQILSSLPFVLNISFPPVFSNVIGVGAIANVNIVSNLGIACQREVDYIDLLILATISPIIAVAFLGLVYRLHLWYATSRPFNPAFARLIIRHKQIEAEKIKAHLNKRNNKVFNSHIIKDQVVPLLTSDSFSDKKLMEIQQQHIHDELYSTYLWIFLFASYIALPSVSVFIFRTFSCNNIDPDNDMPGHSVYMRGITFITLMYSIWSIYATV